MNKRKTATLAIGAACYALGVLTPVAPGLAALLFGCAFVLPLTRFLSRHLPHAPRREPATGNRGRGRRRQPNGEWRSDGNSREERDHPTPGSSAERSPRPHAERHGTEHGGRYKIDYVDAEGEVTTRRIDPENAHVTAAGNKVMRAYCHAREDSRTFRVDRIRSMRDVPRGARLVDPHEIFRMIAERIAE